MIRVAVVDDHALVRAGLCALLDSLPDVTVAGEAGDVDEAFALVERERPDVVLLDLRLGDDDGMEVARRCAAPPDGPRVLVLSAHGSAEQLRAAMAAGAEGYLLKGVTAPQLADGLRKVAAGERVIDEAFLPALLERVRTAPEEPDDAITVRELEVLTLVSEGLTTRAVARRLDVSPRTAQKHLENLHRKLGVSSRAELVQQAFRRGILR